MSDVPSLVPLFNSGLGADSTLFAFRHLHELVEERADRNPSDIAIEQSGRKISYGELSRRSHYTAAKIRKLGLGQQRFIGIFLERSVEFVVSVLAILKSGAAFVPIDINYPRNRIDYIVQDSGIGIILTRHSLHFLVENISNATFIYLDSLSDTGIDLDENFVCPPVADEAYCIYTSGSTGQPKGVVIPHSAVINLLVDWNNRLSNEIPRRFSWWTSVSFDVSIFEIFSALCSGGTLLPVPEKIRLSSYVFFRWLETEMVDAAYLPTFMLSDFADATGINLNFLLVGVEPIQESILGRIKSRSPNMLLLNGYGPTEATIFCAVYDDPKLLSRRTPVGRPISNVQIFILDSQKRTIPTGMIGEIFIGGLGLAVEYLNRPDLTAERFIINPFESDGRRLYRTGDYGRYLSDGNIEFIGRIDNQIKVKGVRVELGEIERVLLCHDEINEAVLIKPEDIKMDFLVAYIVPHNLSAPPNIENLRAYLRHELPSYMIPAKWIFKKALPVTLNGKIDRSSLRRVYSSQLGSVEKE